MAGVAGDETAAVAKADRTLAGIYGRRPTRSMYGRQPPGLKAFDSTVSATVFQATATLFVRSLGSAAILSQPILFCG